MIRAARNPLYCVDYLLMLFFKNSFLLSSIIRVENNHPLGSYFLDLLWNCLANGHNLDKHITILIYQLLQLVRTRAVFDRVVYRPTYMEAQSTDYVWNAPLRLKKMATSSNSAEFAALSITSFQPSSLCFLDSSLKDGKLLLSSKQ